MVRTLADVPKSHIQIWISVIYFAILGIVATFAIVGLVILQTIDLTTFLALVGSFGALAGTIILWLFKSSNEAVDPITEIKEILAIIKQEALPPTPPLAGPYWPIYPQFATATITHAPEPPKPPIPTEAKKDSL